jgi:tetratricopeptide (TPR) repeat protein
MQLGRHERANELYHRAVALAPHSPRFWYNLASSERSFGRLPEAEDACNRAIAIDASQYPTYLLRSELRVQTSQHNHIDELRRQLQSAANDDRARLFLGYALGKELDDLQRFDEAFSWFTVGATTRRRHLSYDVAVDERKLQSIANAFPHRSTIEGAAVAAPHRCIFIVGLPRSGTTLLERILTGLPAVRSNGETDNFVRALMAVAAPGGEDVFAAAAAADPSSVAENYLRLANVVAKGDVVLEKMPMNYLYVGAIHRALPDAKILLVRRSPLDSCFAMYRTLFGDAYPFTYDLRDLARYYAGFDKLMGHWRATLGDMLYEVAYEDLVADPRRVGAAVARHCALSWRDSATAIHNNAAVSLTASAAQVRRPIYGTSSGRWRSYRAHLEPLIRELRLLGVHVPEDA